MFSFQPLRDIMSRNGIYDAELPISMTELNAMRTGELLHSSTLDKLSWYLGNRLGCTIEAEELYVSYPKQNVSCPDDCYPLRT